MVVVFDLDDTLYDEIEFVKSGFQEIDNYLKNSFGNKNYYNFMWQLFLKNGSGKIFDYLIEEFKLNIDIQKLIEIYRFHRPNISLPISSKKILENLYKNVDISLITDGHYITQQNKFQVLGLEKYIEFPIFTDFYNTKKPDLKPFKIVMEKFPNKRYIYIADNPKKDFIAPKKLGWKTIRFKNSKGIYKEFVNDADFEIYCREEIIEKIEKLF